VGCSRSAVHDLAITRHFLTQSPRVPKEKYKLILVEDSEDDVVLFELSLKRTGLHESFEIIRRFPNGDEAIRYFTEPPSMIDPPPPADIVIVDIKLPGRSGFDVLVTARKLNPKTTTAVFTSSVLDQDKKKADELGADLFQTKDFEPDTFYRFLHFLARIADERHAKRL